jgi:predicted signal transduction protein with EAL and GGDEF domain
MEMLIADIKVKINVSIGMTAMYQRTDNTNSVLQQANHALSQAKQDQQSHIFWQPPETN